MECIVLAGGLGTRLRGTIGDFPKCMAPVNGQPFLHYLFLYLQQQGCSSVILSLGYQAQVVIEWLGTQTLPFEVTHVIENEPLGTGGGMQLALKAATSQHVAVLNGDTMFDISLSDLLEFHTRKNATTTLGLKPMHDFSRYGVVQIDSNDIIIGFEEKKERDHGFINGGVYIVDRHPFLAKNLPEKFSFEKEYLEAFLDEGKFYGMPAGDYFIDIGIPEDYNQAQEDFKSLFA